MRLDPERAEQSIAEHVARPLGITPARAALGIHEVVNDNMARAAKVHCLEQGRDPRSYTLVAFGGAGPVHAHRVAAALGMRHVLYPARAGVMSAFGFLVSPPAFELMRTATAPLSEVDPEAVSSLFARMESEGRRLLDGAAVASRDIRIRREAVIRYRGQTFDLFRAGTRRPDPARRPSGHGNGVPGALPGSLPPDQSGTSDRGRELAGGGGRSAAGPSPADRSGRARCGRRAEGAPAGLHAGWGGWGPAPAWTVCTP